MKREISTLTLLGCLLAALAASGQTVKLSMSQIDEITLLNGKFNQEENVYKVSSPRTDIKISVDKWEMPPFMGLTSWAAFQPSAKVGAMIMGDIVLLQDEVNPAMSAALDSGLSVTALHNHFFFDEPKVYFMHIGGEGDPVKLAKGFRAVLDAIKQVRADHSTPAQSFGSSRLPATSSISGEGLQKILGTKGDARDGMFKAVFGRKVKMACGCEVGKEMGVNTWAAFAGSDENAVVDGDFVVLVSELQATLKSLRKSGVNIVAIHSHMTEEDPRLIFFHYWGRGPASTLAQAVKQALDLQQK
jgi:hypothetical protein